MHFFRLFLLLFCFAAYAIQAGAQCLPRIIAYNGLAVSLGAIDTNGDQVTDTWGARVKASDLVSYGTNPCGTGSLTYGIRKSGTGFGFPNASEVILDCNDLSVALLEIWAEDPLGTQVFVESYVLVEDNANVCDLPVPVPAVDITDCGTDLLPPYLEVINGLAIEIQPNQQVTLSAGGFVMAVHDNCQGFTRFRIRKSGTGTGAPTGNSVSFDCNELGTQLVEVWGKDKSGNWNYVDTYVNVQDNHDFCGASTAAGCSPDLMPPVIQVYNGFVSNLVFDQSTPFLWGSDYIHRQSDNCSSVAFDHRIRKMSSNNNPPTTTGITFGCSELGVSAVQVWARDMANNWTSCNTYIMMQDNLGICGPDSKPGGAAKRYWPEELDAVIERLTKR